MTLLWSRVPESADRPETDTTAGLQTGQNDLCYH